MFMRSGRCRELILVCVQYTKAIRLFKDEPKWTPLKRGEETDTNQYRKDYLLMRDGALDSVPDEQRMT